MAIQITLCPSLSVFLRKFPEVQWAPERNILLAPKTTQYILLTLSKVLTNTSYPSIVRGTQLCTDVFKMSTYVEGYLKKCSDLGLVAAELSKYCFIITDAHLCYGAILDETLNGLTFDLGGKPNKDLLVPIDLDYELLHKFVTNYEYCCELKNIQTASWPEELLQLREINDPTDLFFKSRDFKGQFTVGKIDTYQLWVSIEAKVCNIKNRMKEKTTIIHLSKDDIMWQSNRNVPMFSNKVKIICNVGLSEEEIKIKSKMMKEPGVIAKVSWGDRINKAMTICKNENLSPSELYAIASTYFFANIKEAPDSHSDTG